MVAPRVADVCSCLMARRREAERLGILDFSVRLNLQPAGAAPNVDMTASIERGKPYRLGRIEFIGLQKQKDSSARRAFLLDEGDLLDMTLLRRSVVRLDRTNLFEPVGEHDVMIRQNERTGTADVAIRVVERKRGSWALSGPVGPASVAGPFQASISSRLPAWGAGLLDLSTFTASISLFAFAKPLLPLLGLKNPFAPVFALQRPFTPSEGWKSGFLIAPQMGWRASLMSYPITQLQQRLMPVLAGNRDQPQDLTVTVAGPDGEMTTFCEPAKPGMKWLRRGAIFGLQFAGTLASFY
jgi:hypothetical protein